MTASDKIMDDSGEELSVLSIDFGMTNFVREVFKEQDVYNDTSIYEGYSVLFHSDNLTVRINNKKNIINYKHLYFKSFQFHLLIFKIIF